jgi:crotonobetaine/carnitine-CoA ligase
LIPESEPTVLTGTGPDLGRYTTQLPLEQRTNLHLLERQAAVRPTQPWLIFDGADVLTYDEARSLTYRIAAAIRDSVGIGRHVGLLLRNQIEFMPTQMGAMAAPGVAVPLNADARGPLLRSMIERMDVSLLVARVDLLDGLAALETLAGVELVVAVGEGEIPTQVAGVPVERWDDWISGRSSDRVHELPGHDDIGLIALTSGTTGQAKGVVHTHHYWYMCSSVITDTLERTQDDVLTTPLPLFHGAGANLIANSALQCGCVAHLQGRFSATRFWAQAARDGATHAALLGALASLVRKVTTEVPDHRVQHIYCLPAPPEREEWERFFRTRLLTQGWGMTEIFPVTMRLQQIPGVPNDTIGHPGAWTDYAVVDENDNVVAPGEVGELVWRPRIPYAMFSGYYKEPQQTLDAFRNLWFHSGDAASYEPDGMLRFRARLRERIRRRGELVNAAELEYVVLLHPAVIEAAAYGVPAEFGEEDVKLDLVLRESIDPTDLEAWLTQNLPPFMVPRYVEFRDEFPKTPSGRTEKYKLAAEPLDRAQVFDREQAAARQRA